MALPYKSSFTEFCFCKRLGGSREDSRLILCLSASSVIKTTDDFRRSNNACTGECKHSSTEHWREDLVNKLTIPSPLLYCCYATYVPALSDLLVETLVVWYELSKFTKLLNLIIHHNPMPLALPSPHSSSLCANLKER